MENLTENKKESYVEKQSTKLSKKTWIFLGLIALSVVGYNLYQAKNEVKITVLDNDTGVPIIGARVKIAYPTIAWNPCSLHSTKMTNSGVATLHSSDGTFCSVDITKYGYHDNGLNEGTKGFKSNSYVIKLTSIKDPQNLITKSLYLKAGDRADFLSALNAKNIAELKPISSDTKIQINPDFKIENISEDNMLEPVVKIKFFGDGGVQSISKEQERHTGRAYQLENLTIAPSDGYEKELDLRYGVEYVAKLRDGLHYMKLMLGGEGTITFFIQPKESPNLETNSIIYLNTFIEDTPSHFSQDYVN